MTTQQQVKRTNASSNEPHNKTSNEQHNNTPNILQNKTPNEPHNNTSNEPSEQLSSAPATRITYRDCLCDATPHTVDPVAQLLFTVLIIGGMVTFMATFNGLRQIGIAFFIHSHWFYPLIFVCALFVRLAIGARICTFIIDKLIKPQMNGILRAALTSLINVGIMTPIMVTIVTLLLTGTNNLALSLAINIPLSVVVALLVNYFIVVPIVRLVYFNVILTSPRGLKLLRFLQHYAPAFLVLLGC